MPQPRLRRTALIAGTAAVWAAITLIAGAMGLFSGTRPRDLGVNNGLLKACPNKPNCVNSQSAGDPRHQIAPLQFTGDAEKAWQALHTALSGMERVAIIKEEPHYLYAEFTTRLMGYVDDTEFYLDAGKQLIQVRSASRLGYRDFNVNRERIEEIRQRFAVALK
jgi:uncharacterized protein (DUF1499 family)